tara:strand:- start:203 stop:664 length:462 start_codon:yes stop_codon:yes gene_type:complete
LTQIDFYILSSNSEDIWLRFICKVVDKAFNSGMRVFLYSGDEFIAQKLYKLLWTFSQNSFLPHIYADISSKCIPEETIIIGYPSIDGIEEYIISRSIPFDLMINLAEQPPKFFNCFDRLIEIVNSSNKNKDFGRKRFSFYSKNGYEINTHKIN